MTSVHELANTMALSIMKEALRREGRGELTIVRGDRGEHEAYRLTMKGWWVARVRDEEGEAR